MPGTLDPVTLPPPIARPNVTFLNERGVRDGTTIRRTFGPDGGRTIRRVWCPWADQDEAVIRHIGTQRLATNGDGTVAGLQRLTPLPEPGNPKLFCDEVVGITGHKVTGKVAETDGSVSAFYDKAEIELGFKPLTYPVIADADLEGWPDNEWLRYTSVGEFYPSAEYVSMPGNSIRFLRKPDVGSGPPNLQKIPYGIGKVLPILELKVTHHRIPFEVLDLIRTPASNWFKRVFGDTETKSFLGCVNSKPFFSMPAGTVLLSQVTPIQKFTELGGLMWDFVYTFAFCPTRWNFKYFFSENAAEAGWYFTGRGTEYYEPGTDDLPDEYTIYNERDLYDLWRFHL